VVVAAVRPMGGGGGTSAGNGLRVVAFGAGGVLGAVSCATIMKCAIGASWEFLCASGMAVSEAITVEALGVAVCLHRFLDLEPL